MRFSQRLGYTPVRNLVQRESMDEALRTALWNVLDSFFWESAKGHSTRTYTDTKQIAFAIWNSHFREPTDTIPHAWEKTRLSLRTHFFSCEWYEVYDFVEFVLDRHSDKKATETATRVCNHVLETEMSAYRFVDGTLTEITSKAEIDEIEEALDSGTSAGARTHLRAALDLLADRDSPDYRNSIKESISAVESAVNGLTGERQSLGAALKKLPAPLHPALEGALSKLYGWTSDADGIRHALMDEPTVTFEDAKFMLVSCSAFVNYLNAKAAWQPQMAS